MSGKTKPFADIAEIRKTKEAVSKQPELGKVTFSLKGRANGGLSMEAKTGAFIQNGEADKAREGRSLSSATSRRLSSVGIAALRHRSICSRHLRAAIP
jgi:hypothetical protein